LLHQFFKSLAWLEPVVELVRLGVFLAFLLLLAAQRLAQTEAARIRRVRTLAGFCVIVTTAVGITQIDAWPFTNWALVHGLRSPVMHSYEIEGIDAAGKIWPVDKAVLQPMAAEEIAAPLGLVPTLSHQEQQEVARWLYDRTERGRRMVAAGERFPPNDKFLGPLAAPYHFETARRWKSRSDVPQTPFAGVRLVFTTWNIDERDRRGDAAIERRVVTEYRPHD